MSLAGFETFEENLRKLMASRAFQEADDAQRIEMGCRLLNSRYGLGSFWSAEVEPLPDPSEDEDGESNATGASRGSLQHEREQSQTDVLPRGRVGRCAVLAGRSILSALRRLRGTH